MASAGEVACRWAPGNHSGARYSMALGARCWRRQGRSVMAGHGARLEAVAGAAVRTLGFAVRVEIEENAGMRRPQRHRGVRAMGRQVLGLEFHYRHCLVVHLVLRLTTRL